MVGVTAPRTLAEKVWDAHVVRDGRRRARPALHRPAPAARGDQPAGVRRPARWPAARCAAPISRSRPRTTTPRPGTTTRRSTPAAANCSRSPTRPRVRRSRRCARTAPSSACRSARSATCSRASCTSSARSSASPSPALTIVCGDSHTATHGAFGALAFGIGTSEVEHVLATQTLPQAKPKTMAVNGRRRAAPRRHRQGPDPRADHPDRHRRRQRPHRGVPRRGHPQALHGGPDDHLQHEHRVGRQGRHDRARRDHVRVPRGPRARAEGRSSGTPRWRTGGRWPPTRAPSSTPRSSSTPRRSARSSPGAPTRARARRWTPRCRTRRTSSRRPTAAPPAARWNTWACSPARRSGTSRSTWSSSAPAPTAGSRTCAPPPTCCAGTRCTTAYG